MPFRQPDFGIEINDNAASINESNFKTDQYTIFVTHGYCTNSTARGGLGERLRRAYLKTGNPLNVIVTEWGKLSSPRTCSFNPVTYRRVVRKSVPLTSGRLAAMIEFLILGKYVKSSGIHLVGHSLGAHVSGSAGNFVERDIGQKVARISGLDPAGPLYENGPQYRSLNQTDAEFVDVYHTDTSFLGNSNKDLGHADFFRECCYVLKIC